MVDLICNFEEIKKICADSEKYIVKDSIFEIVEINTNLSLLFNIKDPNYIQKIMLSNMGVLFSHKYIVIKVKINNKFKDYTLGLGENIDRIYKTGNTEYTKTQLYIHDWSIYSQSSRKATNLKQIIKSKYRDFYKGNIIYKGKLSYHQVKFLVNIHKIFRKKNIITQNKKQVLIELPFVYSTLGYFFSINKFEDNIVMNCRDFIYFFLNDIYFLITQITKYKLNTDTIKDDWVYVSI